ncbi:MAG TPA: RNA-binding protein [Segetibacter sp.]
MNIYVSNLGFAVKDEGLKELFTPFGEVKSAKIINDRETGRSRGFGFVEMTDDIAAKTALSQLNETTVDGRTMRVAEAVYKVRQGSGLNVDSNNSRKEHKRW